MANKVFVAGLLVLFSAETALAQALPTAVAPPNIVVTGKKVCRRSTDTGSIIPSRTCKTQREWDEIAERSQALLGQMQNDQLYRQNAERCKQDGC